MTQPVLKTSFSLSHAQQRGASLFANHGMPHTKQERWKYTALNQRLSGHNLAPTTTKITAPAIQFSANDDLLIDVLDGHIVAMPQNLPQGLSILPLREVLKNTPQLLAEYWHAQGATDQQPLLGLNVQHCTDGVVVLVDKGAIIAPTIQLMYQTSHHGVLHPRLVLVVGENAQATVVEHYQTSGDSWLNMGADVFVADRAICHHYKWHCVGERATQTITTNLSVGRNASYDSFTLTTGAGWARTETHARLTGDHAECRLNGTYLLRGDQFCDTTILMEHHTTNGVSNQTFKGLLADNAKGVFQGKVFVHQAAQKTDGYQLNNTLLLSDKAEMNVKPELEIYADDVKCSHGATTGQIDEGPLFYMRSRGIDYKTAKRLLLQAFLAPAFDEIRCAQTSTQFSDIATQWLSEVL
jgi:Fe-S cluster assembly protein SufD